MNRIEALSALFEGPPKTGFDFDHLESMLGDAATALIARGMLIEVEPARHIACEECSEPHVVGIETDAAGRDRAFCVEGGAWLEIDPRSLRRLCFNHERFIDALAHATGLKPQVAPLIEGSCWRVAIAGEADAVVIAARGLDDAHTLPTLIAALDRYKKWRGLLVCRAVPADFAKLMPKRFELRTLADLVALDGDAALRCDSVDVARALKFRPRRRGAHGLTWEHPHLPVLIAARFASGDRLATPTAEARWLRAHRNWMRATAPLPLEKGLAKYVARQWEKLAATKSA